jgi:osmoprotectant transport system permease protein
MGFGVGVPLGFSNSYALAMLDERAQKLGIRTLSDLGKHPDLKLGPVAGVHRPRRRVAGIEGRVRLAVPDAVGARSWARVRGHRGRKIDVMDIYTTDAKIERFRLRTLEDDKKFFPRYDAVLLYRLDVPKRIPELGKRSRSSRRRSTSAR